jgi:pilus assembly protein TadC
MIPYKEPSQVLQSLMNGIIEEGRRFASAADMKVSDMSANSPVGTTLSYIRKNIKSNECSSSSYLLRNETRV